VPTPTEIVRKLPVKQFANLLAASPKAFREELFRRGGVKVRSGTFALSTAPKNQLRAEKLHEAICGGVDLGDEVLEELIRNYLYTRRPLLADALNHFEVKNDDGLTEEDLGFLEKLPPEGGLALKQLLESKHDASDVALYLAFMNVPM
jgi:hypothetical protein